MDVDVHVAWLPDLLPIMQDTDELDSAVSRIAPRYRSRVMDWQLHKTARLEALATGLLLADVLDDLGVCSQNTFFGWIYPKIRAAPALRRVAAALFRTVVLPRQGVARDLSKRSSR